MTGGYSLQSSVARSICGTQVKSQTLEIKSHLHTIIFFSKLKKIMVIIQYDWQLTVCSSMARTTCRPHIKNRTLKIKPHFHTIKFYRN